MGAERVDFQQSGRIAQAVAAAAMGMTDDKPALRGRPAWNPRHGPAAGRGSRSTIDSRPLNFFLGP
jgi:hypothetical protein